MAKTKSSASSSPTACIVPSLLYLGPLSSTSPSPKNTALLHRNYITHVLSIGRSPLATIEGITYHRLSLIDTDTEDSLVKFRQVAGEAIAIIDAVAKNGEHILVHCSAGISRSPAIIAAYLIRRKGMRLDDALELLKEKRGAVNPNGGFLRVLKEMEGEVFDLRKEEEKNRKENKEEEES